MAARMSTQSLESELRSFKEHHGRLLVKFEDTDRIMQAILVEKEAAEKRAKEAEKRITRSDAEKSKMKEEISRLKENLQAAEKSLLDGPPNLAELQMMRTKTSLLDDEIKKLKHKLKSRDDDMNYMKIEYEKAKVAAAEAGVELQRVTAHNEELRARIKQDILLLKQERSDDELEKKDSRIQELVARVLNLEESIKRLQVDKQSGRGRYGVRSSSVPRRGLSPAARSRGSSPASGVIANSSNASAPTSHPLQNSRGA